MGKLEELEEEFRDLSERFRRVRGPRLENEEPGAHHIEACRIAAQLISKHTKIMVEMGRARPPRKDARFLHARLLDDDGKPQECLIYRVGERDVFFCATLPDGSQSSNRSYISKVHFPTILKEWL